MERGTFQEPESPCEGNRVFRRTIFPPGGTPATTTGIGSSVTLALALACQMEELKLLFSPMKYRRFGRTGLSLPVISCGGMRYQFKWQDVAPQDIPRANQENLEACIHRALELGINHIETARGYGTSEMQLGNLLPKLPSDKMIVQTKVAPQATAEAFLKIF